MQFMGISLFSIMFAGDGIYLQSTGFWFYILLFLFLTAGSSFSLGFVGLSATGPLIKTANQHPAQPSCLR